MIRTAASDGGPFSAFRPTLATVRTWGCVRAARGRPGACGDRAIALRLACGRTAVVVVDVAGHGAGRAALSSAIAGSILAELANGASPAAALAGGDDRLRHCTEEFPYAVAFVALVHPLRRTVVYASAGHDVAFTIGSDDRVRTLRPTAPMLGAPMAVLACDAVFALGDAETLVVATDGVGESRPARSLDFFGLDGAARAVSGSLRAGGNPARAAFDASRAHAHGSQVDDAAVIVAQICEPG